MYFAAASLPPDVEIQRDLTAIHIDEWLREDAFQLKWWILLAMILIALTVWWILTDKSRIIEIWLFTAVAAIIFLGVHEYGEELTLWEYPVDLIPLFPPLSSINLICLPLVYALIYQYFKTWKSFLPAALTASAAICFVIEPLLIKAGFYRMLQWKSYDSYLMYTVITICTRLVVIKIYSIAGKAINKN